MTEHFITLSTTEPNNYVGLLKMRQGDINTQEIEATITANGQLFKFDNLSVFFNAVLPNGNVIRDKVTEVDYVNSKLNYIVADSFLQEVAQVTAWFSFENGEKIIDSTKNFQYSVIAGWKECIPQGNYIYELSEIQREIEEIIGNKDFTSFIKRTDELETSVILLNQSKADKYYVNSQISSIVSGSPKGTFTTLNALKEAYPNGTEGVFLVFENGHWYYYASGWKDGGVYQGLEIQNDSITNEKIKTKSLMDYNLKQVYANGQTSINLFDKQNASLNTRIKYNFELVNDTEYATTDFIYIKNLTSITAKYATFYAFYDEKYNPVIFNSNSNTDTLTIDNSNQYAYIRLSFSNSGSFKIDTYMINAGSTLLPFEKYGNKITIDNIEKELAENLSSVDFSNLIEGERSKNLLNINDLVDGSYVNTANGNPIINKDYSSNFDKKIRVKPKTQYTFDKLTFYCFYDGNNQKIVGDANGSNGRLTITSPTNAYFLVVSTPLTFKNRAIVVEGSTIVDYESFGVKLKSSSLSDSIIEVLSEPIKDISVTIVVDSTKNEDVANNVFTSLRKAYESITDSCVSKQYEIVVYDKLIDFETLYPHASWTSGYYGLIAKDYVWLRSAEPSNPQNYVLKWDGHSSLDSATRLTKTQAMTKSIMHVSIGKIVAGIEGFTLDVQNARYPLHFETAGNGNTWFKAKNIIYKWSGNPYVDNFSGAILGYGVTCGDHFINENCSFVSGTGEVFETAGHNNKWDTAKMGVAPYFIPPARLTFKNCLFNNTKFRVDSITTEAYDNARSFDEVEFLNCKNLGVQTLGLQVSATKNNWKVKKEYTD